MTAAFSANQVELSREAAFRLGDLEIHPSLSDVEWRGERLPLQPKVMQVLVTLARARGRVLSRDELLEACWAGRVVGDDAINRCIAQARRLGEKTGAFQLETIPRVGHRMTVGAGPVRARRRLGLAMVLVLLVAALAGWAGWLLMRPRSPPSPLVEVAPLQVLGSNASMAPLALGLSADIAGFLNESGVQTTVSPLAPDSRHRRADFRLTGALRQEAGRLTIRVFLEDPSSGVTLWSRDFQGAVSDADRMRDAAAAATAESIYTAIEPFLQDGVKVDSATLALFIRGSEIVKSPQQLREGEAVRIFEQVTARAPDMAGGHGVLAVALVNAVMRAAPADRPALAARTRRAAERAIRLDPYAAGAAYDALHMLHRVERPQEIAAAEDQLLEGLRRAPDYPFLNMRECRLLVEVGRARAALPFCQRAQALRPMAGPVGYTYARALYVNGDTALARQQIETAARRAPDHGNTRLSRFELHAFSGAPKYARALLHDADASPPILPATGRPALDAFLTARETGRPADVEAAARDLAAAGRDGRLPAAIAARGLALLGRTGAVFDLLAEHPVDGGSASWGTYLMEPSMAAVRRDARFWPLARRAGLVAYWQARGSWPDFCGREVPLQQCKAYASMASDSARSSRNDAAHSAGSRGRTPDVGSRVEPTGSAVSN